VDLQTDNQFCGACAATASCDAGQGCIEGTCMSAFVLDGGGVTCLNGGPPITVSIDAGTGTDCTGALAQVTFRWAVCSCTTFTTSGQLTTDAFDSTFGTRDAGLGGAVGANGTFSNTGGVDVGGSCWAGAGLSSPTIPMHLRQDMHVAGTVSGGGTQVASDAFVTGNVSNISIGGKLFVPAAANVGAGVTATGGTTVGPVSVPPPCDCSPSQLIDVAAIVDAGSMVNDNASVGLDPNLFAQEGGVPVRLDLPCGRYFVNKIDRSVSTVIAVHGRVALFVGGNLVVAAPFSVALDPSSEIDIFVGGNFGVTGGASFGSTETPSQTRIWVAGTNASLSSTNVVAGNFYMPNADFKVSSLVSLYGSVFCHSINDSGNLTVHYDRAITRAASTCFSDGGLTECGSCRDCNNQACVSGTCGTCSSDSDCCAPLGCFSGMCQPMIN
jgi:hypothetical protein